MGALQRNILLSLAEAEFFRVRWSKQVLDETQVAIQKYLENKGVSDPSGRAARAIVSMESAFAKAMVSGYEQFMSFGDDLPDPGDAHVLAAAIKAKADTIVTENLKDFP